MYEVRMKRKNFLVKKQNKQTKPQPCLIFCLNGKFAYFFVSNFAYFFFSNFAYFFCRLQNDDG